MHAGFGEKAEDLLRQRLQADNIGELAEERRFGQGDRGDHEHPVQFDQDGH